VILAAAGSKGSPGTTTLCIGAAGFLGARRPVILVEADPDGGCLAARLQISQEPGLGTLAAAGRHELSEQVLVEHLQTCSGRPALIVAPSSPTHARTSLRAVAGGLGRVLCALSQADVVIDLGRLDAESPSLPLASAADHVLFLGRPTLEHADALAVCLVELGELRERSMLVTVGDGPYEGSEVARILGVAHAGHLPKDSEGAALLWSSPDKALRSRRPLVRSMAQVTEGFDSRASPEVTEPAGERRRLPGRRHLAQRAAR